MRVEVAASQRPASGESVSGDEYLVVQGESTLLALADGLGHGPQAREAAVAFCDHVRENSSASLEELLLGASARISRTRGAAAALVRIDPGGRELRFAGIGNICLQSRSREAIRPVSMPGIVGHSIRKIKEFAYPLHDGDLLVLHSDGISSRFELGNYQNLALQEMADAILGHAGKTHDDATCIVARCIQKGD